MEDSSLEDKLAIAEDKLAIAEERRLVADARRLVADERRLVAIELSYWESMLDLLEEGEEKGDATRILNSCVKY